MATILEYDGLTGNSTDRPMTDDEQAQLEADQLAAKESAQAAADKAAANAAAREAAIAHAKSLGFTDAMIAVMYPNLTMEA